MSDPTPSTPQCQSERAIGAIVGSVPDQLFTNWPQNIQFTAPLYFTPRTRSELANAILQAEQAGHHVRAVGSKWSFSDAVCATDGSTIPATLDPVRPGAMIDISELNVSLQGGLGQILALGVDPTYLFHVEAGITINDLNLQLDRQPVRQAIGSGGGRGQTLAGFISTSSHGGDSLVPPLADFVRAIHLVGAGGIEHWIEPDNGITDPIKLQVAYPCLGAGNIHYDTALFNAVLVSAGSMGIVYSFILKTAPQYGLVQHQAASTWEFVAAAGSNLSALIDGSFMASCYNLVNLINGAPLGPVLAPFQGNMFSLVVINPYPLLSDDNTLSGTPLSLYANQHLCIVTNRVPVPIPTTANNPSGPPFDFSQVGHAARNSLGSNVLDYDIRFNNFQNSIQNIPDVSTKAAMLVDFLGQNFDQRTISAAITNVYTQSLPLGDRLDVSYNLSTGVAFGTVIKSLSIEAAFSVTDALAFIPQVFALVQSYAARQPSIYIGGYLSLRVVGKKTAALLGMQRWSPTCCVEYAMIAGSRGLDDFVSDLQRLALACNGSLHWGQCNEVMTAADAQRVYGLDSIQAFRQARTTLSNNLATFDNSFTDRLELSQKTLRKFLQWNRFSTTGVRHLLPKAANGSLRYFLTNFVLSMDRLLSYQQLNVYDQLVSNNRRLVMQGDGNLVLYDSTNQPLWATATNGHPGAWAVQQADGNLVVYGSGNQPLWATGTNGHPGAWVVLQVDGNLVVYDSGNQPLWASNT